MAAEVTCIHLIAVVAVVEQRTRAVSSNSSGSLLTGFAASPGVTTIGNTTIILGQAVFFGSPTTIVVTEAGDAWDKAEVLANIGDNITWRWTSNTALLEVGVVGGVTSGTATENGTWSQQMLVPGERLFRNVRSGQNMTVTTTGLDIFDECVFRMHNCAAVGGVCTNTVGSFTCACVVGFSGDGMICSDNIECTLNIHNCAAVGGQCTNTVKNRRREKIFFHGRNLS